MKRMLPLLLALSLLLSCLPPAAAAAETETGVRILGEGELEDAYYIPTSGTPISGCEQVASVGNGFFTALTTADRMLVGYRLSADGTQILQRLQIADLSHTTGNLSQPSVCVLNGEIFVGWVVIEDEADNDLGGAQYLCKITADGQVSRPVCVCSQRVWPRRPAMAAGDDGILLVYRVYEVVEVEDDWEYRQHNCYAAYVGADLEIRNGYRINQEDFAIYPSVAYAPETGRFLVVWQHGTVTGAVVTKNTDRTPENLENLFGSNDMTFERPWAATDGRRFLVSADNRYGDGDSWDSVGIWVVPMSENGAAGTPKLAVSLKDAASISNGQVLWDGSSWLLGWSCEREGQGLAIGAQLPDFRYADCYLQTLQADSLEPEGLPVGIGTGWWHQFHPRFARADDGTVLYLYLQDRGSGPRLHYLALRGRNPAAKTAELKPSGLTMVHSSGSFAAFRPLCGDGDGIGACVIGSGPGTWDGTDFVLSENAFVDTKIFACSAAGRSLFLSCWAGIAARLARGQTPQEDRFEYLDGYGGVPGIGIWAQDADTAWISACEGRIWRWTAGSGSTDLVYDAGSDGPDLHDIHGSSATDVYAVGDRGLLLHWDGSSWTVIDTPVCLALNAVRADGVGGAWAVGDDGVVLRVQNGSCRLVDSPVRCALYDLWCQSPDRIYVCGCSNDVLCCDQGVWSAIATDRRHWEPETGTSNDEWMEIGVFTDVFGVFESDALRLFVLCPEEDCGVYSVEIPLDPGGSVTAAASFADGADDTVCRLYPCTVSDSVVLEAGQTAGRAAERGPVTGADGAFTQRFTFSDVPAGTWKLAIIKPGCAPVVRTVTVPGDQDLGVLPLTKTDPSAHDHAFVPTVTPPTCTEAGYTRYVCACGESYVGDEVSALGHDWGAPSYTWTENCDTVTAARVCRRDPGHVETETAAASFTVTRPADTEHEGEITFTATFRNPAFGTQTRVIKTPKLDPEDPHPNPFIDVKRDEYYYDSVLWAYYHMPQITTGADEIHYQPEEGCTRAQVVTFLWRAAGKPSVEGADNPFRDVAKGEYYYDAVLWALREGVTTGTDPDRFSPEETCTRAQIVTFLWRYEKKPAPASADNPFRDVPAGEYYTDAVLWAVSKGVTKGTDPDRFSPEETCTRAQIVTFLYRDLG